MDLSRSPKARKSSYSGDNDNCLYVLPEGDRRLLQDSKDTTQLINMSREDLRAFVLGAKAGEFDDLI